MKKLIFAFIIITSLTSLASASTVIDVYGCTDLKATNYNPLATIDNGTCEYPANGDPLKVEQPWKLTGYQTPSVLKGAVVTDKTGIKDTCNYSQGCFDVTGTEWYKNQMKHIARELIRLNRVKYFPIFTGWVNIVK